MITDMQEEQKRTDKNRGSSEMGLDRWWQLMSLFELIRQAVSSLIDCTYKSVTWLATQERWWTWHPVRVTVFIAKTKGLVRWQWSIKCHNRHNYTIIYICFTLTAWCLVLSRTSFMKCVKVGLFLGFKLRQSAECNCVVSFSSIWTVYSSASHIPLSLWPLKNKAISICDPCSQDVIVHTL